MFQSGIRAVIRNVFVMNSNVIDCSSKIGSYRNMTAQSSRRTDREDQRTREQSVCREVQDSSLCS